MTGESTGGWDGFADLPSWARGWVRAGLMAGVPIVILGFYVARDFGFMDNPERAQTIELARIAQQIAQLDRETTRLLALYEEQLKLTRAICRNSAKSDFDRLECGR